MGAHNARNWTASIVIGIELKSVQNGGLGLGLAPAVITERADWTGSQTGAVVTVC